MGEKAPFVVKILLYPLAIIYSIIVGFRNRLFDLHILKSKEFHVPVISVGNIMVGGTGKTPHIEYLIELLSKDYKIAVLSRGYKRKSSNFIIAGENTPVNQIGDEPWQLKEKYPQITVAVDRKRVRGIDRIISEIPDIDVILLDDAFQHRYVKPGVSILLIDFNRPLKKDHHLPYGLLRESPKERYRADIIIFSKSPKTIVPIDRRLIVTSLEMHANQHAFFTSIIYEAPKAVFPEQDEKIISYQDLLEGHYSILMVTGIANPEPLKQELEKYAENIRLINYPDHHYFTQNDLRHIQDEFSKLANENKIILTTEKDMARLKEFASVMLGTSLWYYIPIHIEFHPGEAESFNKYIFHYVRNNNRNSILYKK
jgi:tetraacyldisaccharide 4'-kinase